MSIEEKLRGISSIFLDSAPIIYYVERKQPYYEQISPFFDMLDNGLVTAVSSPITLAECIFHPHKQNNQKLARQFWSLLTRGPNTQFVPTTDIIADLSARLRVQYNLGFADALQVATAVHVGCVVF